MDAVVEEGLFNSRRRPGEPIRLPFRSQDLITTTRAETNGHLSFDDSTRLVVQGITGRERIPSTPPR